MSVDPEKIQTFQAIAGCDEEFALSFLEANGWNLEAAVSNFCDPSAASTAPGAGGGSSNGNMSNPAAAELGGFSDFQEEERAPMAQFRDTLIDVDPAQRVPQRAPAAAAMNHPLEAFRDFRSEGSAGESGSVAGEESKSSEVFGLAKKPKNLAEIYRAPTELCYVGSFDDLRAAGRSQQRWILVNIQSPTEFASQRLNADTWSDETLQAVIGSPPFHRGPSLCSAGMCGGSHCVRPPPSIVSAPLCSLSCRRILLVLAAVL